MLTSDLYPDEKARKNMSIASKVARVMLVKIENLAKEHPNDQELGKEVRKLIKENAECSVQYLIQLEKDAE